MLSNLLEEKALAKIISDAAPTWAEVPLDQNNKFSFINFDLMPQQAAPKKEGYATSESAETNDEYKARLETAAKNIGQMIKEKACDDFIFLQHVPKDGNPARASFINELEKVTGGSNWEIANEVDGTEVLTLYNSQNISESQKNPEAELKGIAEKHFKQFSKAGTVFDVANIQVTNTTELKQVALKNIFSHYDKKVLINANAGIAPPDNLGKADDSQRLNPIKFDTPKGIKVPLILTKGFKNEKTKILSGFNRRDATKYSEDEWSFDNIEEALERSGITKITYYPKHKLMPEETFSLDKHTFDFSKPDPFGADKTLTFFSSRATLDQSQDPKFYGLMFQELLSQLKDCPKDKLPEAIRFIVPVETDKHWVPLKFEFKVSKDKLHALVQKAPNFGFNEFQSITDKAELTLIAPPPRNPFDQDKLKALFPKLDLKETKTIPPLTPFLKGYGPVIAQKALNALQNKPLDVPTEKANIDRLRRQFSQLPEKESIQSIPRKTTKADEWQSEGQKKAAVQAKENEIARYKGMLDAFLKVNNMAEKNNQIIYNTPDGKEAPIVKYDANAKKINSENLVDEKTIEAMILKLLALGHDPEKDRLTVQASKANRALYEAVLKKQGVPLEKVTFIEALPKPKKEQMMPNMGM